MSDKSNLREEISILALVNRRISGSHTGKAWQNSRQLSVAERNMEGRVAYVVAMQNHGKPGEPEAGVSFRAAPPTAFETVPEAGS